MYTPDLLTRTDGTPVVSPAQWEARRTELLHILAQAQYGTFLPRATAAARPLEPPTPTCAGHAMQETLEVRFDTPSGEFAFPLRFLYPADGQAHPLFLLLNFRPFIPDTYCPAEEILDHGFALAVVCYTDITSDDADFHSGLCGHYPRENPATDPGKLIFWAFAASRALDVLTLRPEVDAKIDHPEARPYDQHFLVGAIAPRFAAISSASLDRWADPYSQQLCCVAASPAWTLHGLRGFGGTETPFSVGEANLDGHIAYHLRDGLHYLSRQDWQFYMAFVQRHKEDAI